MRKKKGSLGVNKDLLKNLLDDAGIGFLERLEEEKISLLKKYQNTLLKIEIVPLLSTWEMETMSMSLTRSPMSVRSNKSKGSL
jgi:hypothetical protein